MKNSDEAWTTCTTAPPHRSSARRRDEYPNPGTLIEYWCAHAAVAGTGGAAMLTLVCARSLAKPGACLRSNWFQRWNLDETSRTRISEVRPAASSASANLPERASRGHGIRGASWPWDKGRVVATARTAARPTARPAAHLRSSLRWWPLSRPPEKKRRRSLAVHGVASAAASRATTC